MSQLVVVETGEVVETMTRVEAERITAQIANHLDRIADSVELVMPLIAEALTRGAWQVLGYASPTAYTEDRFNSALTRLPINARVGVVKELTEAGYTTRAIAPIIGKSDMTVRRDQVRHPVASEPEPEVIEDPAPAPQPEWASATTTLQQLTNPEPETTTHGLPKSDKLIGRDGKSYQRPTPAATPKPKRKPLPDQTLGTAEDMTRAAERLADLFRDDRMPQNREQVAALTRSHLNRTIEVCQDLIAQLDA